MAGAAGSAPTSSPTTPGWVGPAATPGVNYEPCIVTFIDVLGFRSLLARRSPGEVHAVMNLLREVTRPEDEPDLKPTRMAEVRMFSRAFAESVSDAVVRVRVYDTQHQDGALFWELLDLLHAQIDCIGRGVLIRAGIAIGDAYVGYQGEGPVFGPAFVRAYEIESREAVHPRIVLDLEVYEAVRDDPRLRSQDHEADEEFGHLDDFLTLDDDGYLFLDYLRAGESEFEGAGDYLHFLTRHRQLVVQGLSEAGDDERVLAKYEWMRRYHDARISLMIAELRDGTRSGEAFAAEYGFDPIPYLERQIVGEGQ